jgi:hypothetical protein
MRFGHIGSLRTGGLLTEVDKTLIDLSSNPHVVKGEKLAYNQSPYSNWTTRSVQKLGYIQGKIETISERDHNQGSCASQWKLRCERNWGDYAG